MKSTNLTTKHAIRGLGAVSILAFSALLGTNLVAQEDVIVTDAIQVENLDSVASFIGSNQRAGGSLSVRISRPDGTIVYKGRSAEGIIDWVLPANLPDGSYRFDVWFTPKEAQGLDDATREALLKDGPLPAEYEIKYEAGSLKVKDGLIERIPAREDSQAAIDRPGVLERALSAGGNFLMPSAHAQDVVASDANPDFRLDDTDNTGIEWEIGMDIGNDTDMEFDGDNNDAILFQFAAPTSSLFIEDTGNIGLGTSTPEETLDIVDGDTPGIRLDDTIDGVWTIQEFSDNLRFDYDGTNSIDGVFEIGANGTVEGFSLGGTLTNLADTAEPFMFNYDDCCAQPDRMFWAHSPGFAEWGIQYSDSVDEMFFQTGASDAVRFMTLDFTPGYVGIGRGSVDPESTLHVQEDSDAKLLVSNRTATVAQRNLFELRNAGKTRFVIENTGNGIWTFDNSGVTFDISRVGTGIAEFQVLASGNARLNNGEMFAQAFNVTSSRTAKTDFSAIDSESMLDKVDQLEISAWRYKDDNPAQRHIGPVAEEFQEVFGIGDGKTISMVDTAGIAFAAIKGLRQEVRTKDQRIDELEARDHELRGELAELRAMIESLK